MLLTKFPIFSKFAIKINTIVNFCYSKNYLFDGIKLQILNLNLTFLSQQNEKTHFSINRDVGHRSLDHRISVYVSGYRC